MPPVGYGCRVNATVWQYWVTGTSNTSWVWPEPTYATTSASTTTWYDEGLRHNQQIWDGWQPRPTRIITGVTGPFYAPVLPGGQRTPEEVAQQERERKRDALIARTRVRVRGLRLRKAENAAERLLLENLTDEQADEYRRLQRFAVVVGDRTYRVRRGMHGNLDVIEDDGQVVERLCVYALGDVPVADNLLAQKLLLEGGGEEYLRQAANITPHRAYG